MRADWQAHIDSLMAQYRTMRDNLGVMQQRMSEVVGTAESEDGLIRASVTFRGELSELEIDPRVLRSYDSVTLAETILAIAQAATGDLREQLNETARPFLPEGGVGSLGGMEKQLDLKNLLPEDPTDLGRLGPPR